uniref:Ribosomal L1 domain-containing protein 1 n=1 Tax=Leptobrachium leishanense TaxID=445787 RepID=A0A8C5QN38_9ANUR
MAETGGICLDKSQVKKASQALFAYQKTKKNANVLLLNEYERISLMVTVWKIPRCEQIIKIALPHGIRPDVFEVCLITRDEPGMSSDQTEKFYKKLLGDNGIKHITEIIPLQKLKKEYKPFEAKRRLLSNFDMFLSDDRVRRFLPSLLGKHFYKEKRQPTSVSLKGQNLAARLNRIIQGTQLQITNKGCCYSIRVGHTGMKVDDLVENISAVAGVLAEKLPMRWNNVKILHLKTQTSVALPVYTSPLGNVKNLDHSLDNDKRHKPVEVNSEKKKKKPVAKEPVSVSSDSGVKPDIVAAPVEQHELNDEEKIPKLVPIHTSNKKQEKKRKSKGVTIHAKEVEKKLPVQSKPTISTPKSSVKRKVSDVKNEEPSMKPSKEAETD